MDSKEALEQEALSVSSSPHLRTHVKTPRLMFDVVIALLPATATAFYFFGMQVGAILASAILGALVTEGLLNRLRGKSCTLWDGSALVTGLLIALILPLKVPLWLPFVGSFFAIAVGKALFGGLGMNLFNPALVGRAFLTASFPIYLTVYSWPERAGAWMGESFDAVSTATPLELLRFEGVQTPYFEMFIGRIGGSIGEVSALALLIGAAYLFVRGVIDWRIPLSYIGTVMILAFVLGQDPLFHLLAGGLILGAFFMASDYVTSPITRKGRLIFGLGCGLLTIMIRSFGGFPEGVAYSILLMNAAVPLIERYTIPRPFGAEVKRSA